MREISSNVAIVKAFCAEVDSPSSTTFRTFPCGCAARVRLTTLASQVFDLRRLIQFCIEALRQYDPGAPSQRAARPQRGRCGL